MGVLAHAGSAAASGTAALALSAADQSERPAPSEGQ